MQLEFPGAENASAALPAPRTEVADGSEDEAILEDEDGGEPSTPDSPSLVAAPPDSNEH
jgi:hypothetical protein